MKKKEKLSKFASKPQEIQKSVVELETKLAQHNINRYSKQSKNPREARGLRRDIAVLKTILRYKELQHE